jgi:hypothetical protein
MNNVKTTVNAMKALIKKAPLPRKECSSFCFFIFIAATFICMFAQSAAFEKVLLLHDNPAVSFASGGLRPVALRPTPSNGLLFTGFNFSPQTRPHRLSASPA